MSRKILVLLIVSMCVAAVSFHFVVEGFGGLHDHFNGRQATGLFHSHDGDLFLLTESRVLKHVHPAAPGYFTSGIDLASHPLPPPFHPPKSL
jgi:hypothetical protein